MYRIWNLFFFNQLCVYVIYTLKNRETTFFKRTNLLVISELMYRMKDNARTFFIVTIISAVSFTAIEFVRLSQILNWQNMRPHMHLPINRIREYTRKIPY